MKNMMKKLMALVLIAAMMMSMTAFSASAENYEEVIVDCCSEEIYEGDEVVLVATVLGVEGEYRIVWERFENGRWVNVGSGSAYRFVANESNTGCDYRALVIVSD